MKKEAIDEDIQVVFNSLQNTVQNVQANERVSLTWSSSLEEE